MGELRWILLGLGMAAIGVIWWWSARRSAQTPGNAELRESSAAPVHTFGSIASDSPAPLERRVLVETREWGVPPLEPLTIRAAADLECAPALDEPMHAHADPPTLTVEFNSPPPPRQNAQPAAANFVARRSLKGAPETVRTAPEPTALAAVVPAEAAPPADPPPADPSPEPKAPPLQAARSSVEKSDRHPPAEANKSQSQRIVAVRVATIGEARWPGSTLMGALELYGLAYGRYQVFHRKHSDGRSIFCVASLIEPGTFDIAHMAEENYPGITLFAVLPGPIEPLLTLDAMLATARELARELSGTVQDDRGAPFSAQRAASMREDVAHFQASAQ